VEGGLLDGRVDAPDPATTKSCSDYVAAYCAHQQRCNKLTFGQNYGSLDTCIARANLTCADELVAAGSTKTLASLDACTAGLKVATCDEGVVKPLPACISVGTLAAGSPCRYRSQCQSDFCQTQGNEWCGVCAPKGAAGASCASQAGCGDGLICTVNLVCAKAIAETMTCNPTAFDCDPQLTCSATSMCEKRGSLNQACRLMPGDPCNFFQDLLCVGTGGMGTCTQVRYSAANGSCDGPNAVLCAASGGCRGSNGAAASVGTCVAPAADGQRCDPMTALRCTFPAICRNGTCDRPAPASTCR
jgi:hypothetical protein